MAIGSTRIVFSVNIGRRDAHAALPAANASSASVATSNATPLITRGLSHMRGLRRCAPDHAASPASGATVATVASDNFARRVFRRALASTSTHRSS